MSRFKFPEMFPEHMMPIERLALLQHYGIPTRLLDVTENALVALFFACKGEPEHDGEVIVFLSKERAVANFPVSNAIAETYLLSPGTMYPLKEFYSSAIKRPYFNEQERIVRHKTIEQGGEWIRECIEGNTMFVYASLNSIRQRMQSGRYILFPNKIEGKGNQATFTDRIEHIEKEDKCIKTTIIINKDKKEQMLYELSLLGITEATLFPDDISKVFREIANNYK